MCWYLLCVVCVCFFLERPLSLFIIIWWWCLVIPLLFYYVVSEVYLLALLSSVYFLVSPHLLIDR
jgi:hypothetical protein